jgi:hypothetical protein
MLRSTAVQLVVATAEMVFANFGPGARAALILYLRPEWRNDVDPMRNDVDGLLPAMPQAELPTASTMPSNSNQRVIRLLSGGG